MSSPYRILEYCFSITVVISVKFNLMLRVQFARYFGIVTNDVLLFLITALPPALLVEYIVAPDYLGEVERIERLIFKLLF